MAKRSTKLTPAKIAGHRKRITKSVRVGKPVSRAKARPQKPVVVVDARELQQPINDVVNFGTSF